MGSLHEKKVWLNRTLEKRSWCISAKWPVAMSTIDTILAGAEGVVCKSADRYSAHITVASRFDEIEVLERLIKSLAEKGFEVLEVPEMFSKEELLALWESPKAP